MDKGTLSTMDGQVSLNATAAAMLGLLSQIGPINGNGLSRCADVMIGDYWTLTRSQVYRELQGLESLGLVNAGEPGPRASREFAITPEGVAALETWLREGTTHEVVRMPILLTMRFGAALPSGKLRSLLEDFAQRHAAKHDFYVELEHDLRSTRGDPYELATVRFGRLFEEAVATWLAELPELLPHLDTPPRASESSAPAT